MPLLETASASGRYARIVLIGGAVKNGRIHYRDATLATDFSTITAIRQFQQANNVYSVELARRLTSSDLVRTNIGRQFPRWMRWTVTTARPLLALPAQRTAESVMTLLCDPGLEGVRGAHFSHIRRLKCTQVPAARRPEDAPRCGL